MRNRFNRAVSANAIRCALVAFNTLIAVGATHSNASDWAFQQQHRLELTVSSGESARRDLPIEITLDLDAKLSSLSAGAKLQPTSVRVAEVDSEGHTVNAAVAFQYNPGSTRPGKGTLVILLQGRTTAHAERRYHVYFDTKTGNPPPPIKPRVKLTDNVEFRGQEAYRIDTPAATYYYHKRGGGFAGMVDQDGNDWIGYRPGGGSAGDYRGIPNLVHPEGCFHPGSTKCSSRIHSRGPLRVLIDSKSDDGKWRCVWGIYPSFARLAVVQAPQAYWFLYEGTPGGRLDERNQFYVLSDGTRRSVGERFGGDIPSPEWLFFADPASDRSLYLVNHHDDDLTDAYWPMQGNMTVFGFGRHNLEKSLTRAPAFFTLGLAESTDHRVVAPVVNGTYQRPDIALAKAESREGRMVVAARTAPPDRTATNEPPAPAPTKEKQQTKPPTATKRQFDWPHWRGPDRNDIVAEDSGYDAGGWPPRETWQKNVGEGSSSPLVVKGNLYVMGSGNGRDQLHCLDAATGNERWQMSYAAPRYGRNATGDQGLYASITSTPEFDPATGFMYTLGADGDLICWDTAARGRRVWGINLYDDYRMQRRDKIGRSGQRDYGYTTSPLVYQNWLLVEVGGNQGTIMAFDKQTGRPVWGGECRDKAGHTGGIVPLTVEGVPCVAVITLNHLLVARLDEPNRGKTVALYPWTTEFANNIASAAAWGSEVLITSAYNHQAMCKLRITLGGAKKVWERPEFSNICTPVIHEGSVYWAAQQPYCLDLATGKIRWTGPRRFGDAGSCIVTADERLIIWSKRGDLTLAETVARSPGAYKELVRIDGLFRDDVWPHAVLASGRLYLKDRRGNLKCLQIGGAGQPAPETADVVRRTGDRRPGPIPPNGPGPIPPDGPGPIPPNGPGPVPPDVPGPVPPDVPAATPAEPPPKIDLAALRSWPGNAPGLILAWRRGLPLDKLVSTVDASANKWTLAPRGKASLNPSGELETAGGAFVVEGAAKSLLTACRRTNQLSIEAVIAPANMNQFGPARIISFSIDPYHRNFTLGQERGHLVLRLRTPRTGENGMGPETRLCQIEAGRLQHVLVAYRDGSVVCYLNGREVTRSSAVRGDFSNWSLQHLLFGDEWQDSRHWHGRIERVALYSRFIDAGEAKKRAELSVKR